jgi:hypothetical protein
MTGPSDSTVAYIAALPEDRHQPMHDLCEIFRKHLPKGFEETIAYKMVSFCVPHSIYPGGYHCDPKIALPFIQIASQKKHLAVYHMGLYAMPEELTWFQATWAATTKAKLDIGKSCIRLDPTKPLPLGLLGQLAKRISVERWIEVYDKMRPKGK